jgi:ERCC4-type nuclease
MNSDILRFEEFLFEIEVIIDTQEKNNYWITDFFEKNNIKTSKIHLDAGDYTFKLYDFPYDIYIERKNSLNELSSNLKPGKNNRDRFYKEFDKIKNCEKYLLVENDNIDNLISGTYGTGFNQNSYTANLILLLKRYNIQLFFINRYNMGLWILKLFYYHYYEIMKGFVKDVIDVNNWRDNSND